MKAAKDADAPVLLMGHGIINRFIAKELLATGWKEQTRPRTGYWGAGVYSRYPPPEKLIFPLTVPDRVITSGGQHPSPRPFAHE